MTDDDLGSATAGTPPVSEEPAPHGMHEVTEDLPVSPDAAWAVLSDPTTYPRWLVGAVEVVDVDPGWPAPGSSFRHRVGVAGPLTTSDSTSVVAVDPPKELRLEARARPFGRAHVQIEVRPTAGGCQVAMREGILRPLTVLTPLAQPLITARNRESLQRLAALPELGG